MTEPLPAGVFLKRDFLAPLAFARVLAALERLAPAWRSSEDLGLLGRNNTHQVRPTDLAAQGPLDEIRGVVAPAALAWARACGFIFPGPPHLQMFPVRMRGDEAAPPRQEPHVDSMASQPRPPICANVFYAEARGVRGGEIALARGAGPDISEPCLISPTPNTLLTFVGDRVHWVRPLHAGERLSIVVNFY